MKKELFALCSIMLMMIAFAPPGQSNKPPIQQDYSYCIPDVASVSAQAAIEVQVYDYSYNQETGTIEFAEIESCDVSPGNGLLCGSARNAVLFSDLSFDNNALPVNYFRTCHNRMGVQNINNLTMPDIYYQPRDGLSQAAA